MEGKREVGYAKERGFLWIRLFYNGEGECLNNLLRETSGANCWLGQQSRYCSPQCFGAGMCYTTRSLS
jgi:hypothetical protein